MKKAYNCFPRSHPEWVSRIEGFDSMNKMVSESKLESSSEIFAFLAQAGFPELGLRMGSILHWALYLWAKAGRRIFRLEPQLAEALMNTELPNEVLDVLPDMPFESFYISAPDVFKVKNMETGIHKGEGVYLFRDFCKISEESTEMVPAIGFLSVGEDLLKNKYELMRDDALVYCYAVAGKPFIRDDMKEWEGAEEAVRLGMNFLLVWNSTEALSVKENRPTAPRSQGKMKRLVRRGLSLAPWFGVSLSTHSTRVMNTMPMQPCGWTGLMHRTHIPGFYRRYWVKNDEGAQVLETKTSEVGNVLSCIRKFCAPHKAWRRGAARSQETP